MISSDNPAPIPAEAAVRAAAAHLTAVESELAQAHARLAAAALAAAATSATPDALTVEQVGAALSLGRSTVAVMIRTGEIRSVKIGKCRRVFCADLDMYIARMRSGKTDAA